MRVGLNLLYLLPGIVGGTQTYAVSLIQALTAADQDTEYLIFLNRESADLEIADSPNVRRIICPVWARRREARYAYEQIVFPKMLQRYQLTLLHSLGYVCPLRPPCQSVVTIHDINYHALKMSPAKRNFLGWFVRQSAHRADHILTVSHFSKQEIIRNTQVREEKITVTHEGPRTHGKSSAELPWAKIAQEFGLYQPYLLAFGSISPHKNLRRLLQAYATLCGDVPQQLLLVGHLPEEGELRAELARLKITDRVLVTGYVPDSYVMPLLEHSDLFVFPSLYEGFGLPALDAQQAGVAVACANAASLPEVAGEGAAYFDPQSIVDMARVLRQCLSDSKVRQGLVEKGRRNVQRFSWEQTALQTRAIYQQVLERRFVSVFPG